MAYISFDDYLKQEQTKKQPDGEYAKKPNFQAKDSSKGYMSFNDYLEKEKWDRAYNEERSRVVRLNQQTFNARALDAYNQWRLQRSAQTAVSGATTGIRGAAERARNTYIPAQFGQRILDNQRQQEYAQRMYNTYLPASLAQDAINRRGTGNDFNAYVDSALRSDYLLNADTEKMRAELDALSSELSLDEQRYNRMKAKYASYGNNVNDSGARAIKRYLDEYEAKNNKAEQIRRNLSDAEKAQKYAGYEALRQNADFAEKSQAGKSKRVQFSLTDPSTWAAGDDRYDFINDIDGYRDHNWAGLEFDNAKVMGMERNLSEHAAVSKMTDGEIAMYNYLYATQGRKAADEYIDTIAEGLNYKLAQDDAENVGDNVLKGMSYGFQSGVERFGTGVADMFRDEATPISATEYGSQLVRENLADSGFKLPEFMGGSSVGQVAFDMANTAGNMAPSILLSVLTSGVGASTAVAGGASAASMGLSAGGSAKAQALREGYTAEQATSYGLLIGASEGALQYLLGGISKLGGKLTGGIVQKAIQNIDDSLLRIASTYAIKMAGEGTEEYLQEILDPIYRNLLFDESNQINLTDPEAVYSFMLGALTAGVLDTPDTVREGRNNTQSGEPSVNGAIIGSGALKQDTTTAPAAQATRQMNETTEQYAYTDPTTGIPMVGARPAQNAQTGNAAADTAKPAVETEEYAYIDKTTGIPMVGERPVRRMNAAADEISTTLDGATKHGYAVQEGANGGADLRAQGKTIHLDAVEATAIAEAYEGGMDAVEYTMAFHTVYEQAKQGKELGQIRKKGIGRNFAKPDIKAAYSAGRLANQRAAVLDPNSEFKAGVTMLPDAQLSKEQETQLNVLDALCRKYGVSAIADDALYLDETGNARSDVNAAYNGNTNRIHINLNAIGDAYLAVGVHELTHYVRANNAAGYSTLENFVLDALRSEGEDVDALVRYQMDQFGYSEETAREEVVANTIPAILNDESYVKKLVEADKTLAERIRDFLQEFIDTIKETLRTLEGEASWKQMQSIRQDTELLSAISDMFDAALGETHENRNDLNADVKYSVNGGARFSAKDTEKRAVEHFGKTYSWNETGYITTSGARLDFSGRHEGAPGGYRTVDHRDILDAYGEDSDMSGSEAMVDFMAQGNIRISPESGGINLSVMPTAAQYEKLEQFVQKYRGEVMLDIDDTDGNTLHSVEYPRNTRASKVLNDIRNYFENGTVPEVSVTQQFRFSIRDASDGSKYVEVDTDQDIFDGAEEKNYPKIARDYINAHFKGRYVGEGEARAHVSAATASEYAYSASRRKMSAESRTAKMRASTELDNLLTTSAFTEHVSDDGRHPEAVGGWDRYRVTFSVSGRFFEGIVNVLNGNGYRRLYDITKIKEITNGTRGLSRLSTNAPSVDDNISIRNSSEKINLSAQDTEANAASEQEGGRATELTGKRKAYKRRHERAFIENVAKAFGIPGTAKGELRKMISELGDRVIETGQLSEADAKAMFEKCYEAAREYDNSMVEQYGPIKEYLRNKAIRSTDLTSEQRDAARGKLRMNGNGAPLVNVYDDLLAEFPGVFDDSLTSPEDQFAEILNKYDSIKTREYTLDEFHGENAAAVKMEARANFEEELFQLRRKLNLAERSETVAHARRQERLRTAAEAESIQAVEKALSEIKEKQKALDRVMRKLELTEGDRSLMDAVFKGGITLGELQSRSNFDELKAYYDAREEVENRKKIVDEYNKKRRERLRNDAMNAIENSDRWKDKRMGLLYARETQERNIRDITGNEQDAERIIEGYIRPVHENEAKRTRYINDMNERMLAFKLNKWESKATQLIGEAVDYKERLAEIEKRGMNQDAEAKLIQKGLDLVGTEYAKLVEKHGKEIDRAKCEAALPTVREIYNQVFQDMNDALVRNGYPKVEYRRNYFPHFIGREYDSEGQKIAKAFGFNLTNMDLPTDIAGLTSAFRPGKTWFANALERMGVKTEFDLYGGFDSYIRGATDVIFHTDDIQRLRALDNAIRYKYSDEGIKSRMQELMENEDLTPEERANQIGALYTNEKGKSMRTQLSAYASNLTEYTNLLANKKSLRDRGAEEDFGRTIYSLANWFQNRYAANAIAGNIGVALSNFIPITQATSEVGNVTLLRAMRDTIAAIAKDDGFAAQSDFLTNRRGTDTLSKDWIMKASDKLSIPFEKVDQFASETLVRAKLAQNLKAGMNYEIAMENADAWAAGLMADRSKGALPTVFGRKNPLTRMFTMFQVEGNNQLSYIFKDVPRDMKEKGITAIVGALFKMFLAAWMYNELDEQITGRRRALDPIHMIAEAVGVDWKTENIIPRIAGTKTADDAPLITYDPQTWVSAAEDTYKNIVDQTPFFGSLLGGDGGRSPAAAAMPDLWRIAKALGDEKTDGTYKGQVVRGELKKPLFYILPPFAGGQVKKAIEGIQTVQEGGSYKKDKGGNDILRFRTDQTGLDYAQAALFGPWALPEGRENIAQGFPVLTAQHTAAYKNAVENGVDGAHFLVLLNEYKQLEPIKDEEGNTVKNTSEQFREILFRDSTLTQEQKQAIDKDILCSDEQTPADYTSRDRFEISTTHAGGIFIPNDDPYERFTENINKGLTEAEAVLVEKWARKFSGLKSYTDSEGNEIGVKEQKRDMLLSDSTLTAEEKQLIDRSLISSNNTPADYSSDASFYVSQLSDSAQSGYKLFKASGGSQEKYMEYHKMYDELEPTKDINGEIIPGSRQEALRNNIMNDDDMTPAQKRQLDEALTGGKTRDYTSWFTFKLGKTSGSAYKRGKAYVAAGISETNALLIEQWMDGRKYTKADLRKYLSKLKLTDSEIEAVLEARY